jgi:hypothetical protein
MDVVECKVDDPFEYNGDFICTRGKRFWKNGEICFPSGDHKKWDKRYRTNFGPSVAHNGVVYAESDHNVRLALRRLTSKRRPEVPGYHEKLFRDQTNFLTVNNGFISFLRAQYEQFFSEFGDVEGEAYAHHADPHEKRLLRIQAWKDLIDTGLMVTDLGWVKWVKYKMKCDEMAKPRKYPRMIGDLGVCASLFGFRLTEILKVAQDKTIVEVFGGQMEFVKAPDPFRMVEIFEKLMDPPGKFYFVCFSDDACLSVRIGEEVKMYNSDVKWCDGSHGPLIFEAYVNLFPARLHGFVRELVSQCEKPIRVYSMEDRKNKVQLKPMRPMLYSGCTITTSINTFANMVIMFSIALSGDYSKAGIERGALNVGYCITLEECPTYHHLQFLKHSPVVDVDGEVRPLLNLGVLLRLSGVCRGDLPGKGDLKKRAEEFQGGLLRSAYPKARFILLDVMSKHVLDTDLDLSHLFAFKVVKNDEYPVFRVDDDELFTRYSLNPCEIHFINYGFGNMGYRESCASTGLDRILSKDYGLGCVMEPKFNFVAPGYWGEELSPP